MTPTHEISTTGHLVACMCWSTVSSILAGVLLALLAFITSRRKGEAT